MLDRISDFWFLLLSFPLQVFLQVGFIDPFLLLGIALYVIRNSQVYYLALQGDTVFDTAFS